MLLQGLGILVAVAVLTDADIPTLEQSIKLGGGFSANGSVDSDLFRNIALGSIEDRNLVQTRRCTRRNQYL